MRTQQTKRQYQDWLNELDIPRDDLKSEGGRIPDKAKYGDWLRHNDPIAFNVGFRDYSTGEQ
jgi:hypothetical protein